MSSFLGQNALAGPSSKSPDVDVDGTRRRPAKRQNVTKACLNCRKRKSRCDGVQPTCGGCVKSKFECTWAQDEDGRKPVSKNYVNALRARIRDLENIIERQGGSAHLDGMDLGGDSDSVDDGDAGAAEEISQALGNLLFNGGGESEVSFYGPTSAYHHLPRSTSQTEEEPPVHSNDHRRYLPQEVPLTAAQHGVVLDRFFRYFASWALRVSPQSFHRDLVAVVSSPPDRPLPRTHCYSPLLHNAILSVALAFADEDELKPFEVRRIFAVEAQKHMEREGQKPTLASVQGFALLSSFHSSLGGHSHGWLSFGLASRAAEALGLNVDCSALVASGRLSELDNKERNHTFWTVFAQEQLWAVYIGRAHTKMEYSTPLPEVDQAIDNIPWEWSRIRSKISGAPTGSQPSMMSTAFVETSKLAILISEIMSTVYGLRSGSSGLHKIKAVSELRLSLEKWYDQLPESLLLSVHSYKNALPHILTLHLAHEWLLILLHRPSYRPVVNMPGSQRRGLDQDSINYAVKTCDRAAGRILQLLKQWHLLFDLAYTNITMPQIAFTAGTTHLLAAVQHRSAKRHKEAISSAQDCVSLLRRIGKSWTSGSQKADILENLINEYVCAGPRQTPVEQVPTPKAPAPPVQTSTPPQLFGIGAQGQAYQPSFLASNTEPGSAAAAIDPAMFSMDFTNFTAPNPDPSGLAFSQEPASPPYYNLMPRPSQQTQVQTQSAPVAPFDHRRYSVGQQHDSQPIDLPRQNSGQSAGQQSQSFVGSYPTEASLPDQQPQPQLPFVTPEFFQALLHHMGLAPPSNATNGNIPATSMPPPSAFMPAPAPVPARPPALSRPDGTYNPYLSSSLQSHEGSQSLNQLFQQTPISPPLVRPSYPTDYPQNDFSHFANAQADLFATWSPPLPDPRVSPETTNGALAQSGDQSLPWANFFGSTT